VSTAPCVCLVSPAFPDVSLLISPLSRRLATVETTQPPPNSDYFPNLPHHRPTPITFQTSPPPDSHAKMEPDSSTMSRVSRRRSSPKAALLASSTSGETGSSMGSVVEALRLGWFPCPDVHRASEEADAESARMPRKRKADDEGFQHPNAKKSKSTKVSSKELYPCKWQDFGWECPITFLNRTK
jgi:hypothetical protein